MAYEYQMVQVPPTIEITDKTKMHRAAAQFLEDLANRFAEKNSEFWRVDTIGILTRPGCLGGLFGKKIEEIPYYVVTF